MNLIKYLPFESYILETKLSTTEVRARLEANIESRLGIRTNRLLSNTGKPYEGKMTNDSFEISRVINYRNSFLPIIKGSIDTYLGKTRITIKMRMAMFVMVFMLFWLGIVGLVCLGILIMGIIQFREALQQGFSPVILIPFGMFLFGSLLVSFGFKAESKKAKTFLNDLLQGQEVEIAR